MKRDVLLIYDGGCRACRWGISLVARVDRDHAFTFCPFGHPRAEAELSRIAPDRRYRSMHAVVGDRLFSGVDAAHVVLRALPLGGLTTALGFHLAYPFVARFRGVLGRFAPDVPALENCRDSDPLVVALDARS